MYISTSNTATYVTMQINDTVIDLHRHRLGWMMVMALAVVPSHGGDCAPSAPPNNIINMTNPVLHVASGSTVIITRVWCMHVDDDGGRWRRCTIITVCIMLHCDVQGDVL
jgi:hypothetical protein